jgi:hypothetical protein
MQNEEQRTTVTTIDPAQETSKRTVAKSTAAPNTVIKRVIYYIAGIIMALIALRFVFLLLGANRESGFVDFIYGLSGVFVAPFNGIFGETVFGESYFETSSIVAIVIYGLIALALGKLVTLNRSVN